MILRDYQLKTREAALKEWQEVCSTLVVQPTGCGKTVTFAAIIQAMQPKRALVIAHREELIWQARDKISAVTGLNCQVEMADYKAAEHDFFGRAPVIVSTVQTLTAGGDGGGRVGKFDPSQFGLLVIDEAHHATAGTYRRVIDYFRSNPDLKVLGVTATPDRADEEALGQVFQTVAFDYEILDAIHDGWLVPIEQQMVNVSGLDFSGIRTTAGDLNGADLAHVLEAEETLHRMAGPSIEIIGQKRALVFTASVRHAEMLAEIFNRHRSGMAAWVCGKTDKDDRRQILSRFAAGELQVVCNCGVLTEGFDDPGVEVVIMGRPTKSRSLYSQMVGRSTRPLPGIVDGPQTPELRRSAIAGSKKPSCLVVDFVGNSGKHKLITSADILGGKVSEEAIERAIRTAKGNGKPVRMDELLDEEEENIREEKRLEEERRRARLVAKAHYSTQAVDPFDVLQLEPVKERGWDQGKVLTEKQRNLLLKQGMDPDAMSFTAAKQIIGEMMRRWDGHLATFKQCKVLRKYGYPTNVTMEEASRTIDILAANNWRRPLAAKPPPPAAPAPAPAEPVGAFEGGEPF